jgi:uncharacterized protein YbaP (TraB family)
MKRMMFLFLLLSPFLLFAQPRQKSRKYPSLLWEISGKGMKKPSYLFGTMHVSSKLAFHLADSFFLGIRNADVVALETNPESWQEDMSKYDLSENDYAGSNPYTSYMQVPSEYLSINTLRFYKYDKKVERGLYSNPSAINNLLYRSYGNEASDFEEDTYLDMYIYQCGKKWGKKVTGVERYGESMKLMMEAYRDAAKDIHIRERSYDPDEGYSAGKLQDAYRSGNLDWLDSINKYNSVSAAFDEKFLYRRNEIQAMSIDSILRSGQSLFVGVGAAHLPGNRGVIEILRNAGYSLRPVKMGARDSQHKNQVERVRVPVTFTTQTADDGAYSVDIPGKFYKFGEDGSLDQRQYADMANGSYYMVTRLMTNAWMWGHSPEKVRRTIDSLLYENIPGKIVTKTSIARNGYRGIDVISKTRRGDIQRYNIFTTPFEVLIFKMSGTGDYVATGTEAKRFFGSIRLKEYSPSIIQQSINWKRYSPSYGGFSAEFPHAPFVGNDGSWIYDAEDKASQSHFRIIRTDVHNYNFAEEDSFDLGLMAESFESSEFIARNESRKQTKFKGYPALDCRYRDKYGSIYLTRFLIQGPHYYSIIAHGQQESVMQRFLDSFQVTPFHYPVATQRKDTLLYYAVTSPVFPGTKKEKLDLPRYGYGVGEDELSEEEMLNGGTFRSKIIANDSTGEKIFVSFFKMQRYAYIRDSAVLEKENRTALFSDSSGIVRLKRNFGLPGGTRVWETVLSDTGSSRSLWSKTFYKNGIGYAIMTLGDTLSKPSAFVQTFFDSFSPDSSLAGANPFVKKSSLFFEDFMSTDSVARKRATRNIYSIHLDSTDIPALKAAINFLNWKEKKYLDTKKSLIGKFDDIPVKAAADYLRELYYAAGDTLELQHAALKTLLGQKTAYSYAVFRDIMASEPPVLQISSGGNTVNYSMNDYEPGEREDLFLSALYDSLALVKPILPGLLPLVNLDDYKYPVMGLLAAMVDSNLVTANTYESYFNKFLIEAKQELKKQAIADKQRAILEAEQVKDTRNTNAASSAMEEVRSGGNEKLRLYATLLLPFRDMDPAVPAIFRQLLASSDKRLQYSTLMLLVRNRKPYSDSLLQYFASKDEYRYELYKDLREARVPVTMLIENPVGLAKSKLLFERSYDKPDSIAYLERLPAEIKGKKGFIYFFKYRTKKDDLTWKLAYVGLVPGTGDAFEFGKALRGRPSEYPDYEPVRSQPSYTFATLSETRLKEEEPVVSQLEQELKRILYARRKSAKEFFDRRSQPTTYEEVEVTEVED